MAGCTCPHIGVYRIRRSSCPDHSADPIPSRFDAIKAIAEAQAVEAGLRSMPACDLCRRVGEHSPLCPVVTMGDRLKDIPL